MRSLFTPSGFGYAPYSIKDEITPAHVGTPAEKEGRLHRADGLRPVSKLPDGPQWLFEIKLDGYRAIAVKSDRGVNPFSRRHKLFNHQYPHVVGALSDLPDGTVV